jgi:hypothetical protein
VLEGCLRVSVRICSPFMPCKLKLHRFAMGTNYHLVEGIGIEFECWVRYKLLENQTIRSLNYPTNYHLVGEVERLIIERIVVSIL